MNKKEMLFIRACKSKNPTKRLKTLHNKIYVYESEARTENNLINSLSNICQDYELMGVADLIGEMSRVKGKYRFYKTKVSFQELCLEALISKIRFSGVSKFDGLIPPARFK